MVCLNVKENCPVQYCRDCEFYNPPIHEGDIIYTSKTSNKEEYKCLKCAYYNKDGFKLNGYGDKLPYTCLTGSEYYCIISDHSLFEKKKKS